TWRLMSPNSVNGQIGTLLAGGAVLVIGVTDTDSSGSEVVVVASQLFDPASETWSPTTNVGSFLLFGLDVAPAPEALLGLKDGRALLILKEGTAHCVGRGALVFDPMRSVWVQASSSIASSPALTSSITLLPDGRAVFVILEGGFCVLVRPVAQL